MTEAGRSLFRSITARRCGTLCAIIALAILATIIGDHHYKVLQDIHWDLPWYLDQAKRFAETSYLAGYREHSHEVAEQVQRGSWPEEYYYFPAAFWYFTRIGNVALLGGIFGVFGTDAETLVITTWIYRVMMVLSLVLMLFLVRHLLALFKTPLPVWVASMGAVISTGLFAFSDVYGYLGRSLISEVPALLLLVIGALTLVIAMKDRASWFAAVSGASAFLLYLIRMDYLLGYLALATSIVLAGRLFLAGRVWWVALFIAATVALVLYSGFYLYFYPLADPFLFLDFTRVMATLTTGIVTVEHYIKISLASTGLLWIGAIASVINVKRWAIVRFALIWLALSLAPYLVLMASGSAVQTRMLVLAVPAWFLASTLGWAMLISNFRAASGQLRRVLPGVAMLAFVAWMISNPILYGWLRELPGGWRLQFVRSALIVPRYEKRTYDVAELQSVSEALYQTAEPRLLAVSSPANATIVATKYFAPSYPADADLVMYPEPLRFWNSGAEIVSGLDRVLRLHDEDIEDAFLNSGMPVLVLELDQGQNTQEYDGEAFNSELLMETPQYKVLRLTGF